MNFCGTGLFIQDYSNKLAIPFQQKLYRQILLDRACVIDSVATIVDASSVILYCWYDNEYGYSC